MGLFSRKETTAPVAKKPEEMAGFNAMDTNIKEAIQKQLSLDDFQTGQLNDQGGYFGVEYDLKTTAGRLKGVYAREPWVFATADKIARTLSTVNFKVRHVQTKQVVDTHPLNKIVSGGNADQDGFTLNWSGYLDLILGGNYFKIVNETYQIPYHLPVELVTPVLKDLAKAGKTDIEQNGVFDRIEISRTEANGKSDSIDFDNVILFKLPNPFTSLFGMSPFTAATRPILLDRNKGEYEMGFYLKGGTNTGVIETTEDITKSRMDRLMRTFEQAFTGKRNWWRTLFLPKGAKWVNTSLTMKDMDHLEGLKENRKTILAILGIPGSKLGLVEDVNRATAETQDTYFWQETIEPLTKFIEAGYNNSHLVKRVYAGEYEVFADLEGHPALEGSAQTRGESAKALDDVATIGEQRTIAKLPPLKKTDPRANMFASQMKKIPPDAAFLGLTDDDLGPDLNAENVMKIDVEITAGEQKHSHKGWVGEDGTGITTETSEGQDHEHQLTGSELENGQIEITVEPGGKDGHVHPPLEISSNEEIKRLAISNLKTLTTANQTRIEKSRQSKYRRALGKVMTLHFEQAAEALSKGKNIRPHLQVLKGDRSALYSQLGLPILGDTMVQGFDLGNSTTKAFVTYEIWEGFEITACFPGTKSVAPKVSQKVRRFTPEDEQAIEAIKRRDEERKRIQLAERDIAAFQGFDETTTENIVQLVEDGLREGKTTEEIAKNIEQTYGETYGDQAFTIARTETLTAISAGIKWHQDTLKQIFSKVDKRWFHVGDVGSNPNARAPHAGFEALGQVPSDFVYENGKTGARLSFPRDPKAGAGDIINCRCGWVSVIPNDATSNSSAILETI